MLDWLKRRHNKDTVKIEDMFNIDELAKAAKDPAQVKKYRDIIDQPRLFDEESLAQAADDPELVRQVRSKPADFNKDAVLAATIKYNESQGKLPVIYWHIPKTINKDFTEKLLNRLWLKEIALKKLETQLGTYEYPYFQAYCSLQPELKEMGIGMDVLLYTDRLKRPEIK